MTLEICDSTRVLARDPAERAWARETAIGTPTSVRNVVYGAEIKIGRDRRAQELGNRLACG